ncbi:hypothetical protein GCM10009114_18550 [Aliiglaciecola litoralis]|uniref:Uncharacterized protein n=2 Tax=Aliiglaciecola litoralis TaxID=582857 RepID=A0ABN1LIE7_9ALTE
MAPDLAGGGAERILITFLECLNREHFEPMLVLCEKTGFYCQSVPKDVPVFSLEKKSRWSFLALIWRFKKWLKYNRPDIVISFLWYADAIQLLGKTEGSHKSICSFHTVPSEIARDRLGWLKIKLLKSLYARTDRILGVSKSVVDEINQLLLNGESAKTFVQHNPFEFDFILKSAEQNQSSWSQEQKGRIVFVGRLEWVKGPDLFLDSLALLPKRLEWRAKIIGTGSMHNALLQQAESLGISDKIDFEGFVKNPFPLIQQADLLVVTSRFEAFPSVIVEALSLQTCAISFDCPTGPAELIDNENGVLISPGNINALAEAIQALIENPQLAGTMAQKGPNSVAHLASDKATIMLEKHLAQTVNS